MCSLVAWPHHSIKFQSHRAIMSYRCVIRSIRHHTHEITRAALFCCSFSKKTIRKRNTMLTRGTCLNWTNPANKLRSIANGLQNEFEIFNRKSAHTFVCSRKIRFKVAPLWFVTFWLSRTGMLMNASKFSLQCLRIVSNMLCFTWNTSMQ